jgi:glycosyltransferase involved in cell wall biosynthesis
LKISYYYTTPFPGSRADVVHIVQMCRSMSALGHDVSLVIPRADEFASDADALQEAERLYGKPLGFRVELIKRITIFGRMQTLGSLWAARKALHRIKPDLIYTRAPWACTFLPGIGCPFIYEIHMIRLHEEIHWIDRILRGLVVRASRSKWCRKVVVISAALADVWRTFGVPDDKLMVAHDAVDPGLFAQKISRHDARSQLSLTGNRPIIVYCGALFADRGVDLMMESARRIPGADFYLVGGAADDLARCRKVAEEQKIANFHLVGQVPHRQVPVWLAASDVLLMMWTWKVPTIAICSPMKLFEYMAAERVIVGPAFPTILEVVRDGEHALLFKPDDLDSMVETLNRGIAQASDSAMPAKAKALVYAEYTWEERCRRILANV